MRRALELAEGGRGAVSPNPLVGAVITRDGEVIGEGYHAEHGGPHAEAAALADCRARGEDPAGATLYVTLEPCAHQGRQPPCAEAIGEAGIERVVVGAEDPSPHASGRGPARLRDAGIAVEMIEGAEAAAASAQIQAFRKHARTGRPLVCLKSAMTLDGRSATADGDSKWITGAESRQEVHRFRAELDAVAVGITTALRDDPRLTAREVRVLRQPTRVVFDSGARLPLDSNLLATIDEAPLLLLTGPRPAAERVSALRERGAEVIAVDATGPEHVRAALVELGSRGITSLMLEGGATLAGSFADAGEIDELLVFIAPLIIGGAWSLPMIGGVGAPTIAEGLRPLEIEWQRWGNEMQARARLREW